MSYLDVAQVEIQAYEWLKEMKLHYSTKNTSSSIEVIRGF